MAFLGKNRNRNKLIPSTGARAGTPPTLPTHTGETRARENFPGCLSLALGGLSGVLPHEITTYSFLRFGLLAKLNSELGLAHFGSRAKWGKPTSGNSRFQIGEIPLWSRGEAWARPTRPNRGGFAKVRQICPTLAKALLKLPRCFLINHAHVLRGPRPRVPRKDAVV